VKKKNKKIKQKLKIKMIKEKIKKIETKENQML